jgi:hypothetical protein
MLPSTNLAARVPTPILIKSFLFVLNADDKTFNPPLISPLMKDWAACPALAASRNARPAPVSKRFIEKDLRLRARLGFLRATIISP